MDFKKTIAELRELHETLKVEVSMVETRVNVIMSQGRALSVELDAKKERLQRIEHAILNLEGAQQEEALEMLPKADPKEVWG